MSKGPGKWQRTIIEILKEKKDIAMYRRLFRDGRNRGLIERQFPELWVEKGHSANLEASPLEPGWITIEELRHECSADTMTTYKALLRAIGSLEKAGKVECDSISIEKPKKSKYGRTGLVKIKLVRISVDCTTPLYS